jgi:pyruvate dehydrogenase E1 component
VLDAHPATPAWLGAVGGHRVRPLGVEHVGRTGSMADLVIEPCLSWRGA